MMLLWVAGLAVGVVVVVEVEVVVVCAGFVIVRNGSYVRTFMLLRIESCL